MVGWYQRDSSTVNYWKEILESSKGGRSVDVIVVEEISEGEWDGQGTGVL